MLEFVFTLCQAVNAAKHDQEKKKEKKIIQTKQGSQSSEKKINISVHYRLHAALCDT